MNILIARKQSHIREEIARRVWANFIVKYKRFQWGLVVFGAIMLLLNYSISSQDFWSLESSIGISFILTAMLSARSTYKSKSEFFRIQEDYSVKLQSAGSSQNFEITETHVAYSDALSTMTMKWEAFTHYSHEKGLLKIFLDDQQISQWTWLDEEFKAEELQLLLSFLDQKFKRNQKK